MYKVFFFYIILLLLSSCNGNETSKDHPHTDAGSTAEEMLYGRGIQPDKDSVLTVRYAIKDSIPYFELTDTTTPPLGYISYGEPVEVFVETPSFYGIQQYITRKAKKPGDPIESRQWELVFIKKNTTGTIDKISIRDKDLRWIRYQSVNGIVSAEEEEFRYKGKLDIQIIDKQEFVKASRKKTNFFISDSTRFIKSAGVLQIHCKDSTLYFTDSEEDNDGFTMHKYMGEIPSIGKYVVGVHLWEGYNVYLIDKISGASTVVFSDIPVLSPDRKKAASIVPDPYEGGGELTIASIKNNQFSIDKILSFSRWSPGDDAFFSQDGYFYTNAVPFKVFWNSKGALNENYQYIRIKI